MSLSDADSGVVDGVSESALEDLSLQSSFEEFVDGQTQNIIESVLGFFVEESEFEHSFEKCVSFEDSSLVVGFEGQQLSGSLSQFGQNQLHSPDLSFVLEPETSNQLHSVPFITSM